MRPLSQKFLDIILREAKGKHAIEALEVDGNIGQVYRLDDGTRLFISKITGKTQRISNAH